MGVDWKANLLRATTAPKAGPEALQRAVKDAVKSGADLEDVKAFASGNSALEAVQALFADGFMAAGDVQRGSALGADAKPTQQGHFTSPGMKVHALRADPKAALPWFAQATLPQAPTSTLGVGGVGVVVDGEHFSPADVADLMRLA